MTIQENVIQEPATIDLEQIAPVKNDGVEQDNSKQVPFSVQEVQGVQGVTPPMQESKGDIFDQGIKNVVGFVAKMTGQPDPQTGQVSVSQAEGGIGSKIGGFFQNLFGKTQQLIQKTGETATSLSQKTADIAADLTSKTQQVATTITEKTAAVADKVVQAPTHIANQASTLIDKGIQAGEQLKDGIQQHSTAIIKDPINGVRNLGEDIVHTTQDLGNQAVHMGTQGIENIGTQAGALVQEVVPGAPDENVVGSVFGGISQGIQSAYEKTKEVSSEALDSTKNFVQNPVESIDAFVG